MNYSQHLDICKPVSYKQLQNLSAGVYLSCHVGHDKENETKRLEVDDGTTVLYLLVFPQT